MSCGWLDLTCGTQFEVAGFVQPFHTDALPRTSNASNTPNIGTLSAAGYAPNSFGGSYIAHTHTHHISRTLILTITLSLALTLTLTLTLKLTVTVTVTVFHVDALPRAHSLTNNNFKCTSQSHSTEHPLANCCM